jgi:uncharacterized membrane protein
MIDKFMLHPLPNTLAVLVLLALIFSWFTLVILAVSGSSTSFGKGWYTRLMLVVSVLGVPAIFDLLQTTGIALMFAVIASLVIVLNIAVLMLRLAGNTLYGLVNDWFKWAIPVLVLGGLSVAGYYVFLDLSGGDVLCGPVEGCDAVRNSRYAILFGKLPMGMFGFAGYIAVLASWLLWQFGPASLNKLGSLSMWGLCVFGVLFSTYLTFLEPFVIGATCMWCITSAVLMMLLLWVATPAAQQTFAVEDEEFVSNRA